MEIIRNATEVSEILRSTLRRGAYFEGAAGVHDDARVHRAAMRAAATLMRKVRCECFFGGSEVIVVLFLPPPPPPPPPPPLLLRAVDCRCTVLLL